MAPRHQEKIAAPPSPFTDAAAQRIVSAARQHFFAHGLRSVTMDDIAGELGMSKKTLYASFAGKTDLLRAVLLDKFQGIESDLEHIVSSSSNVLDSLHQLLACVQQHAGEIQAPFVRDIRREAPEMFQLVQSRRREVIQRYFGKILDEGQKAGIFRKDISTRLMIEILLGATEAIMNPPKMAELGLTPKSGFLAILTVVLEGALTEKGRPRERQGDRKTKRQGDGETLRQGKKTRRQGEKQIGEQDRFTRGGL
ncbi:MAG TPA: TetR/AcrR family transcriptional regulator [Candidatus Binatia bacterium]|nr:TetR/AcrR family transcriptional regulator [Candidatus Binatia bacterium]